MSRLPTYSPISAVRAVGLATVSALALLVAGCSGNHPLAGEDTYIHGTVVPDYKQRHPILITEAPVFLEVDAPRGTSGLNSSQRAEVVGFVSDYARGGSGPLVIAAPSGSRNEASAMHVANAVRHAAVAQGVHPAAISVEPYSADGHRHAPIKVTYHQTVAEGPECGRWSDNLAESKRNVNYGNFGCAMQRNVAAMVAHPGDLLGQRTLGPRSSARRDVIFDKFVKGEPTGAERSDDEKQGNISEVGN